MPEELTLREWCGKFDRLAWKMPNTLIFQTHDDGKFEGRIDLFHLSDYTVSSVAAGVIFLIPREQT